MHNYRTADLPVDILEKVSTSLKKSKEGEYQIEKEIHTKLIDEKVWGVLIDNGTGKVVWEHNVPEEIPNQFQLTDVSKFSRYYLED